MTIEALLNLLIALARLQGIGPEELAALFNDRDGNQAYYNALLIAVSTNYIN